MDWESKESVEFLLFEKITHVMLGRLIQNESERSFITTMFGEKNDSVMERPFTQGGIRD